MAFRRSSAPVRSKSTLWQRFGSTRPGVLLIGRVVSPLQRRLTRATNGRISLAGKAPVLLLTTRGRRTGRPRTVPLFYLRDGDRYVVCNVNPGFERPNPWTLNLRSDRRALVEAAGANIEVIGREVGAEESARYWPALVEMWPAYERFHLQGGTRSIFVLEPEE